jgi:hypothetical protein
MHKPFAQYLESYRKNIGDLKPNGRKWAEFLVACYDRMPNEAKRLAEDEDRTSWHKRLEPHLRVINIFASIAATGIWVCIILFG